MMVGWLQDGDTLNGVQASSRSAERDDGSWPGCVYVRGGELAAYSDMQSSVRIVCRAGDSSSEYVQYEQTDQQSLCRIVMEQQ